VKIRLKSGTLNYLDQGKVSHSGHLSNLENPEEFNRALLDFLGA